MRVTVTQRRDLISNIISGTNGMTHEVCEQTYQRAYYAAFERMKRYVTELKMLHGDVNTGNALYNRDLGDVVFIDWGTWKEMDVRAKRLLHF
jgi:RIO-like serine/threonine protein kinase